MDKDLDREKVLEWLKSWKEYTVNKTIHSFIDYEIEGIEAGAFDVKEEK